jgi:thiamine transporter
VAAAVVLSLITLFRMPLGGSVTPFATLPIIVIGLRHGSKWGVASALVFSLTQLLLGMANVLAVPAKNFESLIMCAVLDYVLAYTLLGFTGLLSRVFQNRRLGICAAIGIIGLGRLACSFLSGVLIWAPYAPEGWNVAVYSLAYNAFWCLPDTAIALVACLALTRVRTLNLLSP